MEPSGKLVSNLLALEAPVLGFPQDSRSQQQQ